MLDLPNFRLGGISTFFDNDLTYFHLIQDLFILLSFILLTWDILGSYQSGWGNVIPPSNLHGLSLKTLVLYSLTFSARLAEYYPFYHLSYDLASTAGFAVIFWISSFLWAHLAYLQKRIALPQQRNNMEQQSSGQPILVDSSNMWLHVMVGITATLAYFYNYSHLTLTPRLFLWAWSHYLDGVAMLPQMWTLIKTSGPQHSVSDPVWIGVNLMTLSKIFQLVDWTYLLLSAEMLDVLAVASALFHIAAYGIFRTVIFLKNRACGSQLSQDYVPNSLSPTDVNAPKMFS